MWRPILLLLLILGFAASQKCTIDPPRVDCGYAGISSDQCLERGCCWDNSTSEPWCYYGGASGVNITTVHVIFSCHLDVGFLEMAVDIVNLYFDNYFPQAISIAQSLKNRGGPERLIFTTHSYLVSLYLDCPSGYGLHCPNSSSIAAFTTALQNGDIAYHAFPFNAELEVYDPNWVRFGVEMTHLIDKQLGLPYRNTLSQRDVPGITRAAIPHLLEEGVAAISVGVNGASTPPNVPRAFVWNDPVSGKSIAAMWHPKGYGGISKTDAVIIPGFDRALIFDWMGDNAGPPPEATVIEDWAAIQAEFPGATIIASTFDDYTNELIKHLDLLPVIDKEIGDTWIYGVPSEPVKTASIRGVMRAVANCTNNKGSDCDIYNNYSFLNFTRQFIKSGEHTWGEDVKTWLADTGNWTNEQFESVRNSSNFQTLQNSWVEQLNWAFDYPLQALPENSSLLQSIKQELNALKPQTPNPTQQGYTSVPLNQGTFQLSRYKLGFDQQTGAITTFTDGATNRVWASQTNPLALFEYITYDADDYSTFQKEYCDLIPMPEWFREDFGKPGFAEANPVHQQVNSSLVSLWQKNGTGSVEASFLVELRMWINANDDSLHTLYGAPAELWLQVDVLTNGNVRLTVTALSKTATRLPEGMFLTFRPTFSSQGSNAWSVEKLGSWIDPLYVQTSSAQRLHGVGRGVRFASNSGGTPTTLYIDTLDAPVVAMGGATAFPTPTITPPDMTKGVSFILWDNTWGTNYVMWWPYINNAQFGDLQYRFELQIQ